MEYFVNNFQAFFLILVRINAMIMIAPFFSSGVIPFRIKAMLSFFITLVIFPVVVSTIKVPGNMGLYYLLVLQEVMIGIYIGFLVSIIFSAFQLSAQYYAAQIGFGINEVLDPVGQVSVPLIGQLKNFVGLIVFLAIDGHHFLIEAIYRSFELAPAFGVGKICIGRFSEISCLFIQRDVYCRIEDISSDCCYGISDYSQYGDSCQSGSADEYYDVRFSVSDNCGIRTADAYISAYNKNNAGRH